MAKILWVVAGALVTQEGKVLLSRRPEGKNLAGFWEYPGGKIEENETPEAALCRELKEELCLTIEPADLKPLTFASFDYSDFHLVMPLFVCRRWQGTPVCAEGQQISFVSLETVGTAQKEYPMPPADDELSAHLRAWAKRQKEFEKNTIHSGDMKNLSI
ncbi:MAG: (deoxy)nucleoside triphosphate pyrophosphohydrolase [Alphaproteobacteria bacterium]|nr:(deoxy)nucleoside triphosphate pyrophosphohydrolase [Alphaproteobacteria bacterium]